MDAILSADRRYERLSNIILVALLSRFLIVAIRNYGFPPGWGGEMASVAMALAQGEGFASPYWAPTGPTALLPPVYPYLLSIIFRLFGIHEVGAGYAAMILNAGFSAAISVPIFLIGHHLFGRRVGVIAAWLWALYPLSGYTEALYIWNTSLYTLLLTTLTACILLIGSSQKMWPWPALGLLTGVTILTDPACLSIIPILYFWLYLSRRLALRRILVASLVVLLVTAPWLIRNYQVFETPMFFRSNLGLELWCGTLFDPLNEGATCQVAGRNPAELTQYKNLGEIAYMQQKLEKAITWISNNPGEFAYKNTYRFIDFWTGGSFINWIYLLTGQLIILKHLLYLGPALLSILGIFLMRINKIKGVTVFVVIMLFYPFIYYVTHVQPRFHVPIAPAMLVLSAYVLKRAYDMIAPKDQQRLIIRS